MTPQDEESRALRLASQATARSLNQWPLVVVLACLAASVAVMGTGHWRKGAFAAGAAVALAGLLRMLLPSKVAGLLAVRSRWADTLLLLACGAGMMVLTLLVPHSPPRGL